MATTKVLRQRWTVDKGPNIRKRILELFKEKAPRSEFENVLKGFPHSNEIPNYLDLRGFPFVGTFVLYHPELTYLDLSYATSVFDEERRRYPEIKLSAGIFSHSKFDGIKTHVDMISDGCYSTCSFLGSNLKKLKVYRDIDLTYCNFSKANLSHSEFIRTPLLGSNFAGANLSYVIFAVNKFDSPDFSGANLKETSFDEVTITGKPNFTNAKLVNTKFEQCDINPFFLPKDINKDPGLMSLEMMELGMKLSNDPTSEYHKFYHLFIDAVERCKRGEDGEGLLAEYVEKHMKKDWEDFQNFYEDLSFSDFGSDES